MGFQLIDHDEYEYELELDANSEHHMCSMILLACDLLCGEVRPY